LLQRDHAFEKSRMNVLVTPASRGLVSSKGSFDSSATPLKVFWPWVTTL